MGKEGVNVFVTTRNYISSKNRNRGGGRGSKIIQNCVTSFLDNIYKGTKFSSEIAGFI
jgi:hypothetical protein